MILDIKREQIALGGEIQDLLDIEDVFEIQIECEPRP